MISAKARQLLQYVTDEQKEFIRVYSNALIMLKEYQHVVDHDEVYAIKYDGGNFAEIKMLVPLFEKSGHETALVRQTPIGKLVEYINIGDFVVVPKNGTAPSGWDPEIFLYCYSEINKG